MTPRRLWWRTCAAYCFVSDDALAPASAMRSRRHAFSSGPNAVTEPLSTGGASRDAVRKDVLGVTLRRRLRVSVVQDAPALFVRVRDGTATQPVRVRLPQPGVVRRRHAGDHKVGMWVAFRVQTLRVAMPREGHDPEEVLLVALGVTLDYLHPVLYDLQPVP